jgi:PncC family amidohydrolase
MERIRTLVSLCTHKHLTIASCESLTAGLFSSKIASCPGASAVLKGALVTYFTEMKHVLAHVEPEVIEEYGVVSQPCAISMAEHTKQIMQVDYCVSFTGNAGPSVMENKPAGRVYCAIASDHNTYPYCFQWDGRSRNEVRQAVVDAMIDALIKVIEQESEEFGNREQR